MDNSMDKYLGVMLDNRYELLEVIGTGGMAVVYKALCHLLNRYVAVKILKEDLALDADFRRRFQTESQAVAMLSHPNIVAVYDVSRSSDVEYIVMELIEGITLKQYMQKKGALSWKEASHFASLIARALSHAHSKGIIHRDIKPHNIMILKDGSLKVADFGIARLQTNQNTLSQEALGSVHYISPEQARGERVDARTDIYSLGVVMYEMLTGRLPYVGDSPVAVALQHINGSPVLPSAIRPDIPAGLEAIILKAMNPELSGRYASADELLTELEAFRKAKSAEESGLTPAEAAPVAVRDEEGYFVSRNVRPVSTSGELSREGYIRRRTRSRKVSMLTGVFCVIVVILLLFIFLWNFWLKGLFSEAERINVPNFVGSSYEDVVNSWDFKTVFNFTVVHAPMPDVPEGKIVSQEPEANKSLMLVEEGIDVTLTVSSGNMMTTMPNVVNTEYREATVLLQQRGFIVEPTTEASSTITKEYIIRTIPEEGEELPAGSTVYIVISGGPEVVPVEVPNLLGLTQTAAVAKLESLNLTVGTISPVQSNYTIGTIIWQSIDSGTQVDEHTKIFLQVSSGPAETPSPSPSPSETVTPVVTEPPAVTEPPVVTDPPAVTDPPVVTAPPVVTDPPVVTAPPVVDPPVVVPPVEGEGE